LKTSTVLIIAGAGVVLLYLVTRSSSTSPLGAPKAPSTSSSNLLSFLGGALGGGAVSYLASPSAKSSSSTSFSSGPTETPASIAQGNYLADTTAASDDASGVVGFGGWDD